MEDTKKLLAEYRSLMGLDDAASVARKEEIAELLKKSATAGTQEQAREFVKDNLARIDSDMAVLRHKIDSESYGLLPLSYIAKRYFGKSAAWLSQRLNGTPVRGHVYTLNDEQKSTFNNALQEIGDRIASLRLA
ncbi:DUF5053 domain-containing protein [uncultured Prevotella sp.]|uniref:DUF5053 domain-containing protein n=1 Tax=uncultured Prevotella sp. TaxID=159272 RepID=UPI0027DAFA6B|nr:DUF5053 domain-containing protein [uncultured Prevotella sp.]